MYCPEAFAENRPEILRTLIQRYPLATLITMGSNGLEANHIPLYLLPGEGPHQVLHGHVARANPLWREAPPDGEVLVIPVKERVVRDGNLITGGGVTAGTDFGLVVAAALRGQAGAEEVQLALEYAPEPPFQAGRPEDAPKDIVETVRRHTETLRVERERMIRQWIKASILSG